MHYLDHRYKYFLENVFPPKIKFYQTESRDWRYSVLNTYRRRGVFHFKTASTHRNLVFDPKLFSCIKWYRWRCLFCVKYNFYSYCFITVTTFPHYTNVRTLLIEWKFQHTFCMILLNRKIKRTLVYVFIELGHKRKCKRTGALMDNLHSNFSKNLHIHALEIFWESI